MKHKLNHTPYHDHYQQQATTGKAFYRYNLSALIATKPLPLCLFDTRLRFLLECHVMCDLSFLPIPPNIVPISYDQIQIHSCIQ